MKPLLNTVLAIVLSSVTLSAQDKKPLKVFILSGQSNMVGLGSVKKMGYIGMDPKTAPMLQDMLDKDGNPVVCEDVFITYAGYPDKLKEKQGKLDVHFGGGKGINIGPEYTFGIYMNKMLGEPILLIKVAWGGKDLFTQFRPPSAGPSPISEEYLAAMKENGNDVEQYKAKHAEETGRFYRMMMDHIKKTLKDPKAVYPDYDAAAGYEIAGFVWFQGYNDWINGRNYTGKDGTKDYSEYTRLLATFIRDIRKDLNVPKMPFVTGVFGMDGKDAADSVKRFREAQAAVAEMPEFKGNVVNVHTVEFYPEELNDIKTRAERAVQGKIKVEGEAAKLVEAYHQSMGKKKKRGPKEAAILKQLSDLITTPEDLKLLSAGCSNQSYHYWGSTKFYAQAGKAFAEALVELKKTNQ